MKARFLLLSLLLLLALVLPSCSLENSLKIGVMLSLTGNAANWGDAELKAVQMAAKDENASLIVEDIGTLDTKSAMNAFRKLVDFHKVNIIIGPTWDMPAISKAANDNKIIMISPDNTRGVEKNYNLDYFFSTWHPQIAEMKKLVEFCEKNNYSKIAIIRNANIFSETVATQFIESAEKTNIKAIEEYVVPDQDKDFRTVLLKVKELNPDAILVTLASEMHRGPILKQITELNISAKMLGTSATETQEILSNYAGYAEEKVYYPYPKSLEKQKEFLKKYEETYGQKPLAPSASNAYDAANIAIELLRETKDTGKMLEILGKKKFHSITFGTLEFNSQGFVSTNSTNIVIKTIEDKEFIVVEE